MSEGLDRRLVAVMFTDMVGYTTMIQADERLGLDKRDRYMSALESHNDAFDGTIVQRLGDGSMSMFPSSLAAVLAAVAIQQELAAQDVTVRVGVHVGEVIVGPRRVSACARAGARRSRTAVARAAPRGASTQLAAPRGNPDSWSRGLRCRRGLLELVDLDLRRLQHRRHPVRFFRRV